VHESHEGSWCWLLLAISTETYKPLLLLCCAAGRGLQLS